MTSEQQAPKALTDVILTSSNVLLREAARLLRPIGISPSQFNVLNALANAPEGLRPSQIADALVVDPSSATYVIEQMVRRGWLSRQSEPGDRRAHRIVRTAQGKQRHAQAAPLYQAAVAAVTEGLKPAELESTRRVVERMTKRAPEIVDCVLESGRVPNTAGPGVVSSLPGGSVSGQRASVPRNRSVRTARN